MITSAYYFASECASTAEQSKLLFVLGSQEKARAQFLVARAIEKGASIIVMARESAGSYQALFQNELQKGVTYIFSRSVSTTLNRCGAIIDSITL